MTDPIIRRSTFTELADWNDHVDRLGERAERAAAAPAASVSLGERAQLATEAVQLLWLALSPAVIAASCRASGVLGEPVLIGFLPLDQQLLAAHRLRDAGVLDQQVHEGQQREPEPEPAEADDRGDEADDRVDEQGDEQGDDQGDEADDRGDEQGDDRGDEADDRGDEADDRGDGADDRGDGADDQGDEAGDRGDEADDRGDDPPAGDQWVTGPELAQLLGVSLGGIRCWNAKGWLIEGEHYRKDPSNRRRHQYNVEAVRAAVASKSRKLRGVEARTPEGAEARRQLRVERQNLRRQAKRNAEQVGAAAEPERHTEPVGQEPERAGGGRLEQLIEALLMEVRGSGG